jgi:hypothetical protein
VEELETTSSRLRETEQTLQCTKTVLQRAASEREEQRHLVEKHVETELKLAQQAKKLLTVRWGLTTCSGWHISFAGEGLFFWSKSYLPHSE